MMSISGIQGLPLEVTVVGCYNLKDTEWISRQDPYVCVEYGSTRYRTKTCTDGGKNPIFQEKFVFPLIEGLRELNIVVWNSNTLSAHDFIGSGRIQLHKALSQGFDDTAWPLMSKSGRHSGEVRLILHYSSANNNQSKSNFAPKASQYETSSASLNQVLPHSSSTQAPSSPYLPTTAYSALPPNYHCISSSTSRVSAIIISFHHSSWLPSSRVPSGWLSSTDMLVGPTCLSYATVPTTTSVPNFLLSSRPSIWNLSTSSILSSDSRCLWLY